MLGFKYKNDEHIFNEKIVNDVPFLSYPLFENTGIVNHGFSTRLGGVSKGCWTSMNISITRGDDPEDVEINKERIAGAIGETSVIALLIGAIFLILMGVIDLRIPGTYILTFVVFIVLFGGHLTSGDLGQFVVQEVCGGGLILGAFFMATDYVTSPITPKGKIIYGIICGCLLGIFRMFGASAEGCSYSIIFANMLVPLIERFTIPKPFGKGGEK